MQDLGKLFGVMNELRPNRDLAAAHASRGYSVEAMATIDELLNKPRSNAYNNEGEDLVIVHDANPPTVENWKKQKQLEVTIYQVTKQSDAAKLVEFYTFAAEIYKKTQPAVRFPLEFQQTKFPTKSVVLHFFVFRINYCFFGSNLEKMDNQLQISPTAHRGKRNMG
jgi:hypothetical protein